MENLTKKNWLAIAIPLFIGFGYFCMSPGLAALNPVNMSWVNEGDPMQAWLGWSFFRNSPWTFPPGINLNYGLELENSIVYTDSNPLMAFLFKPFSAWLPPVFQYFGIWLLACCLLQAWFGWKLIALYTDNLALKILGTCLLTFSLPMMDRKTAHFNLASHFFILAALYMCLKRGRDPHAFAKWLLLLCGSILVHAYIFLMVAVLWIAWLADKAVNRLITPKNIIRQLCAMSGSVFILLWLCGYLAPGLIRAGGFGYYKMNLLAIFDSNGFSRILRNIPDLKGEFEGFNFLGAGGIALLIWTIPIALSNISVIKNTLKRKWPLFAALFCLFAYSLSNVVGIAGYEIAFPNIFIKPLGFLMESFRASARMFWPVYYVIFLACMALIIRQYGKNTAIFLLGCALALQLVDTRPQLSLFRVKESVLAAAEAKLANPFWQEAARKYGKIRGIPFFGRDWQTLGPYAARNNMATDLVYVSRFSPARAAALTFANNDMLETGIFKPDAFYVLDDESFAKAREAIKDKNTLVAIIDGYNIVAPNWHGDNQSGANTLNSD